MKRASTDVLAPSAGNPRKIAYGFVLDALGELEPTTRPMFGSTAVYLGERVLFILRKKGDPDDGVWVAFDEDRTKDAVEALPNLQTIQRLPNVRCWRKLAESHPEFEDDVLEACRLAGERDGPLGKIPVRQKSKKAPRVEARATKQAKRPGARPAKKKTKKTKKKTKRRT